MAFEQNKVKKSMVLPPKIAFTQRAFDQLKLIVENDFTLAGKYFRIVISGKGCDGFTYSAGFTDYNEEDFLVKITNAAEELFIVIDPFAAFYCQEASVDFIQDFDQDAEGFVITNHSQSDFKGKFWKASPEKVPPLKSEKVDA
jgi:Fe-S cluster assembly iron-binding protein IscA